MGLPHSSAGKESACQHRRPWFNSWIVKIHWRRDRLPTLVFSGFPCGSAGKESVCNAGNLGFIPALGRSPGKGNGYPLQYSGLENSMDCIVLGVAKLDTTEQLSLFLWVMGLFVGRMQYPSVARGLAWWLGTQGVCDPPACPCPGPLLEWRQVWSQHHSRRVGSWMNPGSDSLMHTPLTHETSLTKHKFKDKINKK